MMTNRTLLVQFLQRGEVKTLLMNPTDYIASMAAPYFVRQRERYGKFLADLRDQPWVSKLSPTIKDAVTDSSGKVYALPMDQDKSGPIYNVTILNQDGIAVPNTFDGLVAACQTILNKSHGHSTSNSSRRFVGQLSLSSYRSTTVCVILTFGMILLA